MLEHTESISPVDTRGRAEEGHLAALSAVTHRYELLKAMSIDEAVALLASLHKQYPSVPIMVVSTQRPGQIRAAVTHSSAGFISPTIDQSVIEGALKMILADEAMDLKCKDADARGAPEETVIRCRIQSLTSQQHVVLGLLVKGKPNKQIAFELNVSMTTVKAHVSAILTKLGVQSRTQAVILANKVKFVDSFARSAEST